MKLKFKEQSYQIDATNSVVNCFVGQKRGYRKDVSDRRIIDDNLFGKRIEIEEMFSNKPLEITSETILKNVQDLQKEQGLSVSKKLEGLNFTTEMETGTGKTYVYTRTIFELNKQYGWSKFIIMVPSIAIREGVNKSLEITAEHFQEIFGKKIRFFIYDNNDKSNLINIKNFASSSNIEVIIMNYQAFATNSKESRKIYQKLDSLNSLKPIDIIKRTHPILIIDEPQRFGDKAEKTLHEFHPLFTLRYSATHKQDFNKIYRLDAVDAYNHKLVKKINVKGIEVLGTTGTNSFLFLDKINISAHAFPSAHVRMEMEVKNKAGIKKVLKRVEEGDNLYELSGELEEYRGFLVNQIDGRNNTLSFTNGIQLKVGQAIGNVEEKHIRRIQIRETIKSHIEKERIMYHKGIKVLSLFFIDEVAKYRKYDDLGNKLKGEYEQIFEEEYMELIQEQTLFDGSYQKYLEKFDVSHIHNGYFSIDKKGKYIDSNDKKGEGSDDQSAYDLIMKDKEKLLSFDEPTRFIFSHSALREGWDNPNVFQICTLKISESTVSKRQEIGRGLRICVNASGERMDYGVLENDFFDYNTLTVIASESYEEYARTLQDEILSSLSSRPMSISMDVLIGKMLKNDTGALYTFDAIGATKFIVQMNIAGYIDENLKVTDKCIADIRNNCIQLPEILNGFEKPMVQFMQDLYSMDHLNLIENASDDNINENVLKPNQNFFKQEFQDLWKKINIKTYYEVHFDTNELIQKAVDSIHSNLEITTLLVEITTGTQNDELKHSQLKTHSSMTKLKKQSMVTSNILGGIMYDLIGEIARNTNLTRKTICQILRTISKTKFDLFARNPEQFIKKVSHLINEQKATTLINHIVYHKTNQTYDRDLFTINQFKGSLKENISRVQKHIYDYIKTDSLVEKNFAQELETGEVLVYAKLPSRFKISTPIGTYNPDWAIVFDKADLRYMYFIAETKGSLNSLDLKGSEQLKIAYAKKHFEALGTTGIKYDVITSYADLMQKIFQGE